MYFKTTELEMYTTSYIDFAPYVQSFKMFETYLVNFTNDLNSPDIMWHFREVDTTELACSEAYQCRP